MTTIRKLKAHPYANAHIEILENGDIFLFSYSTLVACVVDKWLTIRGLYSATTRKHIGAFMEEFNYGDYYTAKSLYNDGYSLNVETGEVEEIEDHN